MIVIRDMSITVSVIIRRVIEVAEILATSDDPTERLESFHIP